MMVDSGWYFVSKLDGLARSYNIDLSYTVNKLLFFIVENASRQ
jgi:hypothetical protein